MNSFSKTSAILAIAMIAGVAAANPTSITKFKDYKVGLQLYTVRDDCAKDFAGTLKAVAKMGFSGVEFAGYYGHTAQELRQMLDEDHLKCYGSHINLADLEGANFDKTVAFNRVLGNKLVVVPWIPDEKRNSRAALLETCKQFNDYARRLNKEGMMFAYHDHAGDFRTLDGDLQWNIIFANTDPLVKIQFDIGNALEGGVQAAPFLTKYPGRVVSVHVKDFSATNHQALLGEGDEHWNEVLPILKGRNGPRWFIIEQETYPVSPQDSAEKCLRNFERMLAEK